MIVFDLACSAHHVFEAWFGSTDDYESQQVRGLVACPLCGSQDVAKAVMAPNVAPKGNSRKSQPAKRTVPAASDPVPVPVQGGAPLPAEVKAALTALAEMQAKAIEKSEHVGRRFADEARAIHAGDAPERIIHGETTIAEAKSLIEDGVPVAPLPFPVVPPEQLQ